MFVCQLLVFQNTCLYLLVWRKILVLVMQNYSLFEKRVKNGLTSKKKKLMFQAVPMMDSPSHFFHFFIFSERITKKWKKWAFFFRFKFFQSQKTKKRKIWITFFVCSFFPIRKKKKLDHFFSFFRFFQMDKSKIPKK